MVVVRLYGWVRDHIGAKIVELNVSEITLEHVILMLDEKGELLKETHNGSLFVAVNHEIVNDLQRVIKSNDVVAIFPQFSGG
jgi:molybdopterin converting factor small subunit